MTRNKTDYMPTAWVALVLKVDESVVLELVWRGLLEPAVGTPGSDMGFRISDIRKYYEGLKVVIFTKGPTERINGVGLVYVENFLDAAIQAQSIKADYIVLCHGAVLSDQLRVELRNTLPKVQIMELGDKSLAKVIKTLA